jgi:hypothetical protein
MADATPKRKRKTSCPPNRGERAKRKFPGISQKLKELWADPVWREQQLVKLRASAAKRKGKPGRLGVPDGMRKAEAMEKWAEVKESAKQTMAELEKAGLLDEMPTEAREALDTALQVMRMPQDQKLKLAAARLVLDFTKSKPASKSIVAVDEAEAWLSKIAEDNADSGEATKDA